ncbi:MAG: hypothetical protein JWM16_2381, partial [Verrucomicrobiales bacterium]|nr:hypothetical protein [Verrucomicrobiales bacterium]
MGTHRLTRISYIIVASVLVLAGWLQLGAMLVAALFSYFALEKMSRGQRKWVPIALFMILVVLVLYGFGFFAKQAIKAMPDILRESASVIVGFAEKHNIPLPFTDAESLKATIMDFAKDEIHFFGNFAKVASRGLLFLIMGFVVAMSLFLNSRMDLDPTSHPVKNNCYSALCDEIAARFKSLYHSFDLVLGAQLIIALINTTLTSVYLLAVGMPYAWMVI